MKDELFYLLALQQIKGIGDILARKLLTRFGSATAIFEASSKELNAIEGFSRTRINSLKNDIEPKAIEKELHFIEKNKISVHSLLAESYPKQLLEISDAPFMLFFKGHLDLNSQRQIAIVGSRHNTSVGKQFIEALMLDLKKYNPTIVSGLAYGIDIIAHKAALDNGLNTIGVVAHGLDRVYPSEHETIAKKMMTNGGLLTEYASGTNPDKGNFPARNRIVAGMCDATIVIETAIKGGAMITAKLALNYNRDVFALPGRFNDLRSAGCNYLIKTNIAQLISEPSDLANFLDWEKQEEKKSKTIQARLFDTYSEEEQTVLKILAEKELMHVDELQIKSGFNSSNLANLLLQLEFQNTIISCPGKRYKLS